MIQTLSELKQHLSTLENTPDKYKIAVGSLIFTKDDKVILLKRGDCARDETGKLEGVGGALEPTDTDLVETLQREIKAVDIIKT